MLMNHWKISTIALLMLVAFGVVTTGDFTQKSEVPYAFALETKSPLKIKIVPRAAWGADEELTYARDGATPADSTTDNFADADGLSPKVNNDPEIDRVVTFDTNSRKFLWPLEYQKEVKFIVIHHTAIRDTKNDPAQQVRDIFRSHALFRGWGDIGYHYLIDSKGTIYEGRKGGEMVVGGHAKPVNKVSIGISLMGNFQEDELPPAMISSLTNLVDELTLRYHLDPTGKTEYKGKTYPVIHGHGEDSPTLCPGVHELKKLPYLRELISYYQKNLSIVATKDAYYSLPQKPTMLSTKPDQEKKLTLRLKNLSPHSWSTATYLENTNDPTLPRILARISKATPAQSIATFTGTIPKTLYSGLRMPQLRLVAQGSLQSATTFPQPIMVEGLKTTYELIGRSDIPAKVKPGYVVDGWIKFKNTGNFTWRRSGENAVTLGLTRPREHEGELFGKRTRIAKLTESVVRPGEVGTFAYSFNAPSKNGTYSEYLEPLVEKVTWMGDTGIRVGLIVDDGTVKIAKRSTTTSKNSAKNSQKPLRVRITTFSKSHTVQSASQIEIFSGSTKLGISEPQEPVTIWKLSNGRYRLLIKGEKERTITTKGPVRLRAKNSDVLELTSLNRPPAWNKKLNDNLFKGVLEFQVVDGVLEVINEIELEEYLKGIGEVSNGDPVEKVKTIVILARSYALYYRDIGRKFPGKPYDLDDDPNHTQKYLGYGIEKRAPNLVKAVLETRGQVVTYNGALVLTPYFTQSDGRTRSAEEVWGIKAGKPYLQSVPDTFCGSKKLLGHGVGLSGCGATALAKQGKSATAIIQYYLHGVEISPKK